jgi:exopolysaccharide biosynthesis polyprenyl glycosylphosphotransferase
MALSLVMLEAGSLFVGVFGTMLLWSHPGIGASVDVPSVLGQSLAVVGCCLVSFYLNDLYDLRSVRSFAKFLPRLVESVGIAFFLVATLHFLLPDTRLAERRFVSSLLLTSVLVVTLRAVSYRVIRSNPFAERVLILGTGGLTSQLLSEIERRQPCQYTVVGVADDVDSTECLPARYPLRGPLRHLDKIVEELHPDRVIVALAERRGRLPVGQLLDSRMHGIPVEDALDTYERLTGKVAIEALTPSALIFSRDFRESRVTLVLRRAVSLLIAVLGLTVLAPLFGLIALAIRLDSRGPVFFVQDRVGLYGRRFRLLKFRTMRPANGHTSEWARDNGDRITRVGRWLRKSRLDELPQFVNVLRGEMNLVGPRPHPTTNVELFRDKIPYYWLRLLVRPGITGWAQVRYGYANDLREETEKMRYDLFYIKHASLWLDLRILFHTTKIVSLGREGR